MQTGEKLFMREVSDALACIPLSHDRSNGFATVFGRLNGLIPDGEDAQRQIIFDPVPCVDGIESSGDPLLDPRASVYLSLAATGAERQRFDLKLEDHCGREARRTAILPASTIEWVKAGWQARFTVLVAVAELERSLKTVPSGG